MRMGRMRDWWNGETRAAADEVPPSDPSTALVIPSRTGGGRSVSGREALGVGDVFRAVEIRCVAAKQISFDVQRGGHILPTRPALLDKPDVTLSRGQFIEQTVASMALAGNAYWRHGFNPLRPDEVATLWVMNPHDVTIRTAKSGRVLGYTYRGEELSVDQVSHLARLRAPGSPYGLGPIQAAQVEMRGVLDVSEYGSNVLYEGDVPSGILKAEAQLTKESAEMARDQWKESRGGRHGVAVLGQGFSYQSVFLSPKDAQFIESQQWNAVKITRLFGVPASLMLVSQEGASRTYQNVDQDWAGFVRFGLANDLTEIEDAFTALLPRGQRAVANTAALLKSDTKTRYETHNLALGRWRTVNEIRAIEGLEPIPGGDELVAPAAPQTEKNDDNADAA